MKYVEEQRQRKMHAHKRFASRSRFIGSAKAVLLHTAAVGTRDAEVPRGMLQIVTKFR